jgi:hypothetical protein
VGCVAQSDHEERDNTAKRCSPICRRRRELRRPELAREQHALACCHLVIISSATDFALEYLSTIPRSVSCRYLLYSAKVTTKSPRIQPITAGEYDYAGHAHLLTTITIDNWAVTAHLH